MSSFSHTDETGKARMVDVSNKTPQWRVAKAEGRIHLLAETVEKIKENQIKKGDVLTVAEIAGIQAAKQCGNLIPLCHPLLLTQVQVHTFIENTAVRVEAKVRCTGSTGVEMEALTAVSVALLTIYDMCKAIDKQMVIDNIHLLEKTKTDIPHE